MKETLHCLNERQQLLSLGVEWREVMITVNFLCLKLVQSGTTNHSFSRGVKNGTAFHQRLGPGNWKSREREMGREQERERETRICARCCRGRDDSELVVIVFTRARDEQV